MLKVEASINQGHHHLTPNDGNTVWKGGNHRPSPVINMASLGVTSKASNCCQALKKPTRWGPHCLGHTDVLETAATDFLDSRRCLGRFIWQGFFRIKNADFQKTKWWRKEGADLKKKGSWRARNSVVSQWKKIDVKKIDIHLPRTHPRIDHRIYSNPRNKFKSPPWPGLLIQHNS